MRSANKYPRNKVIAVDVDGTLFISGKLKIEIIDWCRDKKEQGFSLVLWSARGEDYAWRAAVAAECVDLFDFIIGKPGYIIDDKGWSWVKYTKVVRWNEIADFKRGS